MPELMQLGPDDIEINPPFSPCPADYPPCPLCGKHPDMLESGHIVCCNIIVDSSDAWFLLPRALTWTNEPPKVAGFYWHIGSDMSIYSDISGIMTVYAQNGELGYLKNGEFCTKFEADDQWAGPIPPPID